HFARYAERVTAHLGDLLPWVVTLNEPNVIALVMATGIAPTAAREQSESLAATATSGPAIFASPSVERMAAAHRKAFDAIKAGPGDPEVGWTLALPDFQELA